MQLKQQHGIVTPIHLIQLIPDNRMNVGHNQVELIVGKY